MKIRCRVAFWIVLAGGLATSGSSTVLRAQTADAATTASVQTPLPEAPIASPLPKQKAGWSYVAVTSSLFAASIANAETLERCDNCRFVPASLHRRGATYGIGLPADVAISYLTYRWKKQGHRWWFVPEIALAAANAYLSYHWATNTDSPPAITSSSAVIHP